MTNQSEALRLADAIDPATIHALAFCREAAAELRRLVAENESLRQIVEDFPPIEAELREVSDSAHRMEAQRDLLLAALKRYHSIIAANAVELDCDGAFEQAIAAIKAVEE